MTTFVLRRPYGPTASLLQLNRAIDDAFNGWPFASAATVMPSSWVPPCDVVEDKAGLRITLELPGIEPEDVKLSLENRELTVRGEKKRQSGENVVEGYRFERTYGSFERTFTLPETIETDQVQANYANGVLTISLPEVEKARPREIPVRIQA